MGEGPRYIPVTYSGRKGRWEIQDRAKDRQTVARFMTRTLAEKVCQLLNTDPLAARPSPLEDPE